MFPWLLCLVVLVLHWLIALYLPPITGQCDFVQGRAIVAAISMDEALDALRLRAKACGVGLLIDFPQAFPGLAHGCVFLLLQAMRLAAGLIGMIRSLYRCHGPGVWTHPHVFGHPPGLPRGPCLHLLSVLCRGGTLRNASLRRISTFADDLAPALSDVRVEMARVAEARGGFRLRA